jgi:hypothetical protein
MEDMRSPIRKGCLPAAVALECQLVLALLAVFPCSARAATFVDEPAVIASEIAPNQSQASETSSPANRAEPAKVDAETQDAEKRDKTPGAADSGQTESDYTDTDKKGTRKEDSGKKDTDTDKKDTDQKVAPTKESGKKVDDQDHDKDDAAKKDENDKKPAPPIKRETDGFDVIPGPRDDVARNSPLEKIYRALQAAQIRLKFATAEHGNLQALADAQRLLAMAAGQIAEARASAAIPDDRLQAAEESSNALQHEIDRVRRVAAKTLYGKFALIRGFGPKIEEDEEFEVVYYSLAGAAHRWAVRKALDRIAKAASTGPLYVLVLVPGESADDRIHSPLAKMVDAEVLGAFAGVADARVYSGALRTEFDPMPAWDAPDPAFAPFCQEFLNRIKPERGPRSLMLVMVREFSDEKGDQHWVQAQHRTFELSSLEKAEESPEKLEADKVRSAEAMTHDKSRFNIGIVNGAIGLWGIALLVHYGLSVGHGYGGGWARLLAIPTASFVLGLALAPLIVVACVRWLPNPETYASAAAWWPCTAGALALFVPAGVFRMVAGSVGRYLPDLSCHGRWGISFVPVALGVCAGWLRPACFALGLDGLHFMMAMVLGAGLLTYCFGRAIDLADHFPVAIIPIVVGLALAFGGGAFSGSPLILWSVALAAALVSVSHALYLRWRARTMGEGESTWETGRNAAGPPRTVAQLRQALESPPYHPPREFDRLRKAIEGSAVTRSTWIGLVGPTASGKTAAARQLIGELQASEGDLLVLVGQCAEQAPRYQPFKDALAELGVSPRLMASRSDGGEVNNFFDRLADEFVPFWDYFSSSSDDDEDEGAGSDLLTAITNALEAASRKRTVVLFLDDIQWIDEGSKAVLKHLRDHFAPGGEPRLLIIVAARDTQALEKLDLEERVFSLTPPSAAEQQQILERGLGIESNSARRLIGALGSIGQEAGGMFWLIRAIQELVAEDAFAETNHGFELRPTYIKSGRLPVPSAMREKLAESLTASGAHRAILECAALLGERFRIDDLAECLELDRLELLTVLRELEREWQLVRDIPSDQERYAFSSTFLLEIMRQELGVVGVGAKPARPSKIARELHARIAAVFERRTPRTAELTFGIARHYFAAGKAYAEQSRENCLAAAQAASRTGAADEARKFAAMAEQSARLATNLGKVVRDRAALSDVPPAPAVEKSNGHGHPDGMEQGSENQSGGVSRLKSSLG